MADQGHAMVVVEEEDKKREYRRGNWTLHETMILIEAKKMDTERRLKRVGGGGEGSSNSSHIRPSELRWKWVEDYCWRLGCLRSQNQCNDKWDNLMRDYKKVRDYESGLVGSDLSSYWKLERNERKKRGLPSNMLGEIHEAMTEVLGRKRSVSAAADVPLTVQYVTVAPPPPPPPSPPTHGLAPLPNHISSGSDGSQYSSGSPPLSKKKRKRRKEEGTSNAATTTTTNNNNNNNPTSELATAISKGACVLAEALLANEEREKERHKKMLGLEEKRLRIQETKANLTKQYMDGLLDSINKLANSILALASASKRSTQG